MRLLHELRVASYFYCTSYKLLFVYELRVTVYCTSYELLLTYELQVTVYCTSYELLLLHKLRVIVYCQVNFYMRVRSYFLTMSYSKDKDDKAVYDNKILIKNNYLGSFFDK